MRGDAFGPRFRASRRATACLALSASIAIALSGCDGAFEADPIQYSTVAGYADMSFGQASVLARQALSDGYLSNVEYYQVIDAVDEQREAEYRLDRDRAILKWSAQ